MSSSIQETSKGRVNYFDHVHTDLIQQLFIRYFGLKDLSNCFLVSKKWSLCLQNETIVKRLKAEVEQVLFPHLFYTHTSAALYASLANYARVNVRIYLDISGSMNSERLILCAYKATYACVSRALQYIPFVEIFTFSDKVKNYFHINRVEQLAPLIKISRQGQTKMNCLIDCLKEITQEQAEDPTDAQNQPPFLTKIYVLTDMDIKPDFVKQLKIYKSITETHLEFVGIKEKAPKVETESGFTNKLTTKIRERKLPYISYRVKEVAEAEDSDLDTQSDVEALQLFERTKIVDLI